MQFLRLFFRAVIEPHFVLTVAVFVFIANLALGKVHAQSAEKTLPGVTVKEAPSTAEKNQLPATTESVTREKMGSSRCRCSPFRQLASH
jgi:hypothetical protein